jgi:hypothetical protein
MKTIYIASPITLCDTSAYADIEKLVKRLYPEERHATIRQGHVSEFGGLEG